LRGPAEKEGKGDGHCSYFEIREEQKGKKKKSLLHLKGKSKGKGDARRKRERLVERVRPVCLVDERRGRRPDAGYY